MTPRAARDALRMRLMQYQFGFDDVVTEAPPEVGWPMTVGDILKYATYVERHVTALDQAWANWHNALRWDNGGGLGGNCGDGASSNAEAARLCHPEFYDQQDKANLWNKEVVLPKGWDIWSAEWHAYYKSLWTHENPWWWQYVPNSGYITWDEVQNQVCGGFCGDYVKVKDLHADLIKFSDEADKRGLLHVPDPGKLAIPKTIGEKIATNPVTGDLVELAEMLLIGAFGVWAVGQFLDRRSKK